MDLEAQRSEARRLLKTYVARNDDPSVWSETEVQNLLAALKTQLYPETHDLVGIIDFHKKLLPRDPGACFKIGEKFLEIVSSPVAEKVNQKQISLVLNNCFAYIWNFVKTESEKYDRDLNFELCMLSLRFSLLQSISNLNDISRRLQQASAMALKVRSPNVLGKNWNKLLSTMQMSFEKKYRSGKNTLPSPSEVLTLEEGLGQLLHALSRHFSIFPTYSKFDNLCERVVQIAQRFIDTLELDLVATYASTSEPEIKLKNLASLLDKHRSLVLSSQYACYDIFEYKSPWRSWSQQWVLVKKDNPQLDMVSVYDLLKKDVMDDDYRLFLCKALRCEINSYFSWKMVLADALITAGKVLVANTMDFLDAGLGVLAQGIGFWFGGKEYETHAVTLCRNAIQILNKGVKESKGDSRALIIASVAYIWLGMCKLRLMQSKSICDLTNFKLEDQLTHPSRHTGLEDEEGIRVIPGISTVTMADEFEVGTLLRKGVDTMYKLLQLKDIKESVLNTCPSLVTITLRLAGHLTSTFGDSVSSIKAWRVVYKLATFFDNRLARLVSGAELIKQVPDLEPRLVSDIEGFFQELWGVNKQILKSTRPHLWKLQLAKATVALHTKDYQNGVRQLEPIIEYRREGNNFDISHLLMGEAYYILAKYILLDPALGLKFSGPDHLVELSPLSLATKALKHLSGMARDPDFRQSGWSDVLHNHVLLSTLMQVGSGTTEILASSGRIREMRMYSADLIFFTQQMGLISRTVQLILQLADVDMTSKSYDSCEMKILALNDMLDVPIVVKDKEGPPLRGQNVADTLEECGVICKNYKKFVIVPDVDFKVDTIIMPQHHYPKGDLNVDKTELETFDSHKFKSPNFLFHSLKCGCYVCLHPLIIPLTVKYLQLLASYAIHSKVPVSGDIIRAASKHHLRGMFRILHQFLPLLSSLNVGFGAKAGKSCMEQIFVPFFYEPVVKSLLIQMELASPERIEYIVKAHNLYISACNKYNPTDILEKQKSFDILASALVSFLFKADPLKFHIRGSQDKETLSKAIVKKAPTYSDALSPDIPPETTKTCPPGPVKRGLRSNRQKAES